MIKSFRFFQNVCRRVLYFFNNEFFLTTIPLVLNFFLLSIIPSLVLASDLLACGRLRRSRGCLGFLFDKLHPLVVDSIA
jgi:hypothetical protein